MAAEYQLTFPYALLTALTLLGLTFTVLNDPYLVKRDRRLMLIIAGLCACLIIQNYANRAIISKTHKNVVFTGHEVLYSPNSPTLKKSS